MGNQTGFKAYPCTPRAACRPPLTAYPHTPRAACRPPASAYPYTPRERPAGLGIPHTPPSPVGQFLSLPTFQLEQTRLSTMAIRIRAPLVRVWCASGERYDGVNFVIYKKRDKRVLSTLTLSIKYITVHRATVLAALSPHYSIRTHSLSMECMW